MAREKPELGNIFKRTEPAASGDNAESQTRQEIPASGRTMSVGVGLKESEVALMDHIATEFSIARNALLRFAVRRFLEQYMAGEIDLDAYMEKPKPKNKLRM